MKLGCSCLGLLLLLLLTIACGIGCGFLVHVALTAPELHPSTEPSPPSCPDCPPPVPAIPNTPQPTPTPAPTPAPKPKPPRPWVPRMERPVGLLRPLTEKAITMDGPVHNNAEVTTELPADLLVQNTGGMGRNGPGTGAGLCVFTSGQFSAWYQNEPVLFDLQKYMTTKPGGGWPEKVDQILTAKYAEAVEAAQKAKQPIPQPLRWIHYQGRDPAILWAALDSGRMPAITFGRAHMTSLWGRDRGMVAVRDNNYVSAKEILWMSEATFLQKWTDGGSGWTWILCNPRPPAPPRDAIHANTARPIEDVTTAPFVPGHYEWRTWADELDQWSLFRDNKQIGNYTSLGDFYREKGAADTWGKTYRRPPVPLPDAAYQRLTERVGAGVFLEATERAESYTYCGQPSTKEAVFQMLDDAQKPSLTVIGSVEECERFRLDLERPENAGLRSHVLFQSYRPDNWAVARYGFVTSGHPTVYLQAPNGTPLWHVDHYAGPTDMIALRKADPNYKPTNDPGQPQSPLTPATTGGGDVLLLLVCLGGSGLFLLGLMGVAALTSAHLVLELLPEA